jgi:peptidoglycan/xylan/chitin deacetylase (PgdA/CDA1 family)
VVVTGALQRLLRAEPDGGEPVVHRGTETQWLRRGDWRVLAAPATTMPDGETLASFATERGAAVDVVDVDGVVHLPFDPDEAYANYVGERWVGRTPHTRLKPRHLDAFYRVKPFVPRGVQLAARRALIRRQGVPEFPAWPVDLSVARLVRLAARAAAGGHDELRFAWFWPEGATAAVTLSHDVENADGLRLCLRVADLEEELGFRSSFNVGAWYDLDPGIARELRDRGFEIGCHALTHDRALFESRASFEERLPALRRFGEEVGAVGFRSPATHRVDAWLSELPFDYDGTVPHSDPYEPQPGGCCSLWPFFAGDVVEVPYTLPQDHTLFTLLREGAQLWIDAARRIEEQHGLVHCISHPDPGYLGDAEKLAGYRELLEALRERPLWRALPRDVASWWRRRDAGDAATTAVASFGEDVDDVELRPLDARRAATSDQAELRA